MNRKFLIFCFTFLLPALNAGAQMHWLYKYDLARSIAASSGRLLIVDFWASWCGPCKVMDQELWQSPEMQKIAGNFVGVRINVDAEKTLTSRYGVKSIPRVIIMTINGDIIWDVAGYDYAGSFISVFNKLPVNVTELNLQLKAISSGKSDVTALISAGIEFQDLGKNILDDELKSAFLKNSVIYFDKALKACDDPVLAEEIKLNSVLNDVHAGRYEKALKTIAEMDSIPSGEKLADLKHFILAKCYKGISDQENFLKEKELVTKKELLQQLEY